MTVPTLVATVGHAPQVVTRALDWLIQPDVEPNLAHLVLVHTRSYNAERSHWPSFEHFVAYLENHYAISVQLAPIQDSDGRTILDTNSVKEAEFTFNTIFNAVRELKRERRRMHGLIAGGRKNMVIYMMLAAQLLFHEEDRLWHLFSEPESQAPHDRAASTLIEIPVFQLATTMPMMHALIVESHDPAAAMRLYRREVTPNQLRKLQAFYYEACDQLERDILRFAYRGMSNDQIGEAIGLAGSSVSRRVSEMADRFYTAHYGGVLRHRPKHIRQRLLDDLRPLLRGL
jgi:CRISPR-associated protein Csx14